MYKFIKLGLTKAEMIRLNACRMYLHVAQLSDIVSLDGKGITITLLTETDQGLHRQHLNGQIRTIQVNQHGKDGTKG